MNAPIQWYCSEHKAPTKHIYVEGLGGVCESCLHTYWRLHERFLGQQPSKPVICEVCEDASKPARLLVDPATAEAAEVAYVLCQDCATTAAWTM